MRKSSNTIAADTGNMFTHTPPKLRPRNREERLALEAAGREHAMLPASRKGPRRDQASRAHKRRRPAFAGAH